MQDHIKSLIDGFESTTRVIADLLEYYHNFNNNNYDSIDLIFDSLDDIIFQNILYINNIIYLPDLLFRRIFSNKKIKVSEYLLLDSIIYYV